MEQQHNKKRIVIVGATSSIAEHCARLWVKNVAIDLMLIARNSKKVERVANDLRVRSPQSVIRVLIANFIDPASIGQVVLDIVSEGPVDTVLIAHGTLADQTICQQDLTACHDALLVNGISPVLFAEAFVKQMQKANHGTLAIIGSVAGDRGRKSNYIYGAAKGMIERYVQGLRHRLAKTAVRIILIKPGPTDTPMTHSFKQQGSALATVDCVTKDIVRNIGKGKPIIYSPARWAFIMAIVKHLPRFIFEKMEI